MNSFGNPHSYLVEGIRRMYNEGQYTDITIKITNQTFQCHSLVLSSVSAYFEAMFNSGMKESREMTVTLHDIAPDMFREVLNFVYSGKDVVDSNNVGDLLQISTMLQLVCLTEKCEEFMIKNIDSENCLNIWKVSKLHNCVKLKEISELHILSNFDDVIENCDLVQLELNEFEFLLKNKNLRANTEETVCTAVLNWVSFDLDAREERFESLFRCIRLTSLPLEYLLDILDQHPLVQKNKECFKLVRNAIKYHALPARRQDWSCMEGVYRHTDGHERILSVVGRRSLMDGSKVNEFIGYSFQQKRWMALQNIPTNIGEDFAVCSFGDDVFVTGGTEDVHSCIQYSAKFSQWRKRKPLNVGRYRHCMVAVRESLYVLGGYNFGTLGSIEEYDIHSELWKPVGELYQAVDAASAAVVGNKIYIFGGWLGAQETAAIQCFDTISALLYQSFFPSKTMQVYEIHCYGR
ncbi:hypothetical protein FSP39_009884 [Pinctada imbricata]|uniref:BTB domain-containing protein n=1 Tax=Pinctada imbricata TaxID=66713 RepID=A0AA88XY54_PINIB|nr:hypothetical protein FSP39_009884 [Pinctada imbricata]